MKHSIPKRLRQAQRRIEQRLAGPRADQGTPMFTASNIRYELADKTRGIGWAASACYHLLVQKLGLAEAIDRRLHLLKIHLPYHESDHVLNIAYNALCNGTCLEDIELRRNDEVFLDALGAERIPDPTTAGDFCRRFDFRRHRRPARSHRRGAAQGLGPAAAELLRRGHHRHGRHPRRTTGECKAGMDIAYDGTWGYHPLVVISGQDRRSALPGQSLGQPARRTKGPPSRSTKRSALCLQAPASARSSCAATPTSPRPSISTAGTPSDVRFVFGYDAMSNLKAIADEPAGIGLAQLLRAAAVRSADRGPADGPRTSRTRSSASASSTCLRLQCEEVAEFDYRPTACKKTYRLVVVRKHISREKGESAAVRRDPLLLLHHQRPAVRRRGSGVRGQRPLRPGEPDRPVERRRAGAAAPVDTLVSNWA